MFVPRFADPFFATQCARTCMNAFKKGLANIWIQGLYHKPSLLSTFFANFFSHIANIVKIANRYACKTEIQAPENCLFSPYRPLLGRKTEPFIRVSVCKCSHRRLRRTTSNEPPLPFHGTKSTQNGWSCRRAARNPEKKKEAPLSRCFPVGVMLV